MMLNYNLFRHLILTATKLRSTVIAFESSLFKESVAKGNCDSSD